MLLLLFAVVLLVLVLLTFGIPPVWIALCVLIIVAAAYANTRRPPRL